MNHNISRAFSKASKSYDSAAEAQKLAANLLIEKLDGMSIPCGGIWEIGCGTGFVTKHLVSLFPYRYLRISDLSQSMLDACKAKVQDFSSARTHFIREDSQKPFFLEEFSLIISNCVFQWFSNLEKTLQELYYALDDKGVLLFSLIENCSFPEWKSSCEKLHLPFTRNSLPQESSVKAICQAFCCNAQFERKDIRLTFPSSFAFFSSLKKLGANTSLHEKSLTVSQMKRLMALWDKEWGVEVTYSILFGKLVKKTTPLFKHSRKIRYAIS